jgi:heme exporter protein D
VEAVAVPVVVAHLVSTVFLAGMIWTIQIVHYPLFALVGDDRFPAYEAAHSARITGVIVLPWAVQGVTTLALLLAPPQGLPRPLIWVAAVLAVLPVVVTVVASVPAHTALADGFDAGAHARLVTTNWVRTVAWTAHGGVAVGMLFVLLRRG